MRSDAPVYQFGPFELDTGRRRLRLGRELVSLQDRQLDVLLVLVANAGRLVTKGALTEAVWRDVAVTDNTVVQAVVGVRRALGDQPDGSPYVETRVRKGYCFVAPVERQQARQSDLALDALLEPHRAFMDGRAMLETLDRDAVARARQAFEDALVANAGSAEVHVGLANACVLVFEATRADSAPDRTALARAEQHAREGCRLDPESGEAWSTLAFVEHRLGHWRDAVAAARRGVSLEPHEWRHHARLALVSWGGERLRAAHAVLTLCPGLPVAHWCAATVFVAREAYDKAFAALRAGCATQDTQRTAAGPFTAVGLHLLHGLVLAAVGELGAGVAELERELAFERLGHVYARQSCANAWYAIGALRLRNGHPEHALAAFQESLARVPGHGLAAIGATAAASSPPQTSHRADSGGVRGAILAAVTLALEGKHHDAASVCENALRQAPPGPHGWLLPVAPLLHPTAHRESWAPALATLRDRAV